MAERILFTGDSITDTCRVVVCQDMERYLGELPLEQRQEQMDQVLGNGYPLLVASQLYAEFPGKYKVLNRGVSGNRIVDLDARVKCDCINLKPDVVSIMIGINDVWHEVDWHNGVDAPKFERVYDGMLEEIRAALPGVKFILLEPYVLKGTGTQDKWDSFRRETDLRRDVVRRLAQKYQAACIDSQALFDQAAQRSCEADLSADGVHPTPAGHWLLAQAWLKAFQQM